MSIIIKKNRSPLSWHRMREEMNKKGLYRTPGEKNSLMSAHGEFYRIMEKLSAEVWKYYHPDEDSESVENKKLIRGIARADYFEELVEDVFLEMDEEKVPKK